MAFTDLFPLPTSLYINFDCGLLCVPATRFYYLFTPRILTSVSEYYAAYRRRQSPTSLCSICRSSHSSRRICLPPLFDEYALIVFIRVFEGVLPLNFSEHNLIWFVRLCGYFLIKPQLLHDLLVKHITCHYFEPPFPYLAFLVELHRQGFPDSFSYFFRFVRHKPLCSALSLGRHPYNSVYSLRRLFHSRERHSRRGLRHHKYRISFSEGNIWWA